MEKELLDLLTVVGVKVGITGKLVLEVAKMLDDDTELGDSLLLSLVLEESTILVSVVLESDTVVESAVLDDIGSVV